MDLVDTPTIPALWKASQRDHHEPKIRLGNRVQLFIKYRIDMVVQAFNLSTLEQRQANLPELEASKAYIASSRPARVTP